MEQLTVKQIAEMMESENWGVRFGAMEACAGRSDVPIILLVKGLYDENFDTHLVALKACVGRKDIPIAIIEKEMKGEPSMREMAMEVCIGRKDIPVSLLMKGLKDESQYVQKIAKKACAGRADLPYKLVKKVFNSMEEYVDTLSVCESEKGNMPINKTGDTAPAVEFISYNGKYPNLCNGELRLRINGEDVLLNNEKRFGYPISILISGGSTGFGADGEEYVERGEWDVKVPEAYACYADQIRKVVNENVEYGCCGGCL